jgi:preprotein translocase subunit YajC
MIFPMIAIGLIFYFLVIRPQNRRQKDLEKAVQNAQKGDVVVTAGGLHGKVHSAQEHVLTLEIANVKGTAVRVDVDRARIERVVGSEDAKKGGDDS